MTRSRGASSFAAWCSAKGGIRAAARDLGKAPETVRRWAAGERVPGDVDRRALEKATGTPSPSWDVLEAKSRAATKGTAKPKPAEAPRRERREPAPADSAAPDLPVLVLPVGPPPSVAEMQARSREIPRELAAIRSGVLEGSVAVTAAETLRRLLTDEAKALGTAITAQGTATVEEVEQLRALVRDVTAGCEGCRARVTAALREMGER